MILLSAFYLINLAVNARLIGRRFDITDNTQGYGKAVFIVHHGKFQLQSIVFTMGIMNENIFFFDAIFTDFHYFQSEAFLHKTKLFVFTEAHRFAMFQLDGMLTTTFARIDGGVSAVVKDHTILQNFAHRGPFMPLSCLEHFDSMCAIVGYSACKEATTSTE